MGFGWPGCCCACGSIRVTVRRCDTNALINGATVTVKDSMGVTVGTCTTDATGICSVDIDAAGTYTVIVGAAGLNTATTTVAATCSVNNITVKLGLIVRMEVQGCDGNIQGLPFITVTLTHSVSGNVYTGISDTNTTANVIIPVQETGTFNYSIPAFRHTTATGTYSVSGLFCTQAIATKNLAPATGYHCQSWSTCMVPPAGITDVRCEYPIPDTLHLTDSMYGAATLIFGSYVRFGGVTAFPGWRGTHASVSVPACPSTGCAAATVNITYTLWQVAGTLPGVNLMEITFPVAGGCPNPSGAGGSLSVRAACDLGDEFCPPQSTAWTLHMTGNNTTGNLAKLYCTTTPTFTVTE